MSNKLAHETSPYLLQHKDNPVEWYPWGDEALARSRDEAKPIFLSIGYSACHWCHVMEHESFENEAIAKTLNDNFVCIKVDREERPDIDQIYMNAVHIMTGHGGWPMSMFLLPDLRPFYGGTYWPPQDARGMPGFERVLTAVLDAFNNRPDECLKGAEQITAQLKNISVETTGASGIVVNERLLIAAGHALERSFDQTFGGFGDAPKFPAPMALGHLLRLWKRTEQDEWLGMVRLTLDRMAAGGIYDHVGGGFARYSVDERWLVPHFEKMLYDNALLVTAYTEAWQATGEASYRAVACETLDYLLRDMTDPSGGFYSAEDADSEGHEGIFYTWTPTEVEAVLGQERAELFGKVYGVTDRGNFEGRSILHLPKSLAQLAKIWERDEAELANELAECRCKLFAQRETRVRPGRDDKVLVAWNGLAIAALAKAGTAFDEPRYVEAATKCADFLLAELRTNDGRLLHTWKAGQAKLAAYLDDYASLAHGLVALYQATFNDHYVTAACELMETVLKHFGDASSAGFYFTADDHEQLLTRNRDFTDNATPSGNAVAATVLLELATLTGRDDFQEAAEAIIGAAAELLQKIPHGTGQTLIATDLFVGPNEQCVIVGPDAKRLGKGLQATFNPRRIVACSETSDPNSPVAPLFKDRPPLRDSATLYICQGQTCQVPIVGTEAITSLC